MGVVETWNLEKLVGILFFCYWLPLSYHWYRTGKFSFLTCICVICHICFMVWKFLTAIRIFYFLFCVSFCVIYTWRFWFLVAVSEFWNLPFVMNNVLRYAGKCDVNELWSVLWEIKFKLFVFSYFFVKAD